MSEDARLLHLLRFLPDAPARVIAGAGADETHLRDYWRVLARQRWTVLATLVAALLIAILWAFTTRPTFTATATIRIEREEPRVLKFEEVLRPDPVDYQQTQYQTQIRMLHSRTLANRVIGRLQLAQHPEFQATPRVGWVARARASAHERLAWWLPSPLSPLDPEGLTPVSSVTEAFLGRLTVSPVRNARLVRVSFESHYADLAARAANAVAATFIAQQLEQKIETTRAATRFLTEQVEDARTKLEVAEGRLSAFLERNGILFVAGDGVPDRQDLVTRQVAALSDALLKARATRIAKESLVTEASRGDGETAPAVLQSALVARLREELVTLEGRYRELGQTFKPQYPSMQRVAENIAEVRRQLRNEIARIVEGLDAEYRAAARDERQLQRELDAHRGVAQRVGSRLAQYALMRREVDASRDLHAALLTRLKETQIASALFASNISLVDRAEMPSAPSKPRRGLIVLIASAIGLVAGFGGAFFLEYLDPDLKDVRDVESTLRVPTLALVPAWTPTARRRWPRSRVLGGRREAPLALVAHTELRSVMAEAFRGLRTSLIYSTPDHPPRSVMITSLQTSDGKTSLATNLAIALAQLGSGEVLLVELDMRRPDLHEILQIPLSPGLSTYLCGQAELSTVIRETAIPKLSVITAGRSPANPAELVASVRLDDALQTLGDRFAHIVVDAPPLLGVSDAMILAPRVGGVILVLRRRRAHREAAQRATQLLDAARARLLGVVLNDVDPVTAGAYGYYDHDD